MKKPRRIFYTTELPARDEIDLSKAKSITEKELQQLLKKSADRSAVKKNRVKKAA
jgi:hypothetical protein